MSKNKIDDYGCFTFQPQEFRKRYPKWFYKLCWTSEGDYIEISLNSYDGTKKIIVRENYNKATLRDVRIVFDYLIKYYRTYR